VQTSLLDGGPFPKGLVLNRWLGIVGALGDGGAPTGELSIKQVDHNANLSASNTASTSWIVPDPSTTPAPTAGTTLSFSFNTPLGTTTEAPCGRVIFGDMHAGGDSADDPSMPVPAECSNADLSPQEKALEFMLFDLSACVVPDNALPPPVQIVAP
jgi:hypothetical protein